MPKIIDDLRDTLLAESRKMLLSGGELTIRGVAKCCHVAVGTVYNYFKSKDELMAYVMLEDWQQTVSGMQAGALTSPDAMTGLRCVYDGLTGFYALYNRAWVNYAASNDASASIRQRHGLVIAQLTGVVEPLLVRHGVLWTPCLPTFLSETLLSAAGRGEGSFEQVRPILERLVNA